MVHAVNILLRAFLIRITPVTLTRTLWWGQRGALGRDGVARIYRRLFYEAAITGRKTGPHALRHTFGTAYIRAGGSVRQLQNILEIWPETTVLSKLLFS